jgi:hypothetical protein
MEVAQHPPIFTANAFKDTSDQVAYGVHWEHSREHQNSKSRNNNREENWVHARKSGMGPYGRLRGMELGVVAKAGARRGVQEFYIERRFDFEVLGSRLPRFPGDTPRR